MSRFGERVLTERRCGPKGIWITPATETVTPPQNPAALRPWAGGEQQKVPVRFLRHFSFDTLRPFEVEEGAELAD